MKEKQGRRGRRPLSLDEKQRRKQERAASVVDLHIDCPIDLVRRMDAITDNRTRYAIEAIQQRLQRDNA